MYFVVFCAGACCGMLFCLVADWWFEQDEDAA